MIQSVPCILGICSFLCDKCNCKYQKISDTQGQGLSSPATVNSSNFRTTERFSPILTDIKFEENFYFVSTLFAFKIAVSILLQPFFLRQCILYVFFPTVPSVLPEGFVLLSTMALLSFITPIKHLSWCLYHCCLSPHTQMQEPKLCILYSLLTSDLPTRSTMKDQHQ